MDKVYLETSVVSYLAAWPSRDLIVAAHQEITHRWWRTRRSQFELYSSQHVIDEASGGDEQAARKRLAIVRELPLLDLNDTVVHLSEKLVSEGLFPETAAADALHVAVATVHGMDFLLTWNCRHLANAEIIRAAAVLCGAQGYEISGICTPEELLGG